MMRALAQSQERTRTSSKKIEATMTIAMGGMDVDIALLVKLKWFIEEQCIAGLCSVKIRGALTHKHLQMVVKGNFVSLPVLKKKIKLCLRMG